MRSPMHCYVQGHGCYVGLRRRLGSKALKGLNTMHMYPGLLALIFCIGCQFQSGALVGDEGGAGMAVTGSDVWYAPEGDECCESEGMDAFEEGQDVDVDGQSQDQAGSDGTVDAGDPACGDCTDTVAISGGSGGSPDTGGAGDGDGDAVDPIDDDPDACQPLLPADACGPAGVCGTLDPICNAGAWSCDYRTLDAYEPDERTCDGLDNDCDGAVDEGCTLLDDGIPCRWSYQCASDYCGCPTGSECTTGLVTGVCDTP